MPEFTMEMVREWWRNTTGESHYNKTLAGLISKGSDAKLREYIRRLCLEGVIEPVGKRDGMYRLIQEMPEPVDWQGVDEYRDFPIVLPFELRKYVWIDPGSSIMVAGSKDSGKSGFILRTVAMNMYNVNTVLISNIEGGISQIKRRFNAMDIDIPTPAPFKIYHAVDNFHDFIKEPNTLYAVDYIDVPDTGEYFMIAPAIAKIQTKLRAKLSEEVVNHGSVALIGLQKSKRSDIAFGGEQTLKKASLYLAMDKGRIKIVSAKVHADPKINPTNMAWTFQYDDEGTKFINPLRDYGDNGR